MQRAKRPAGSSREAHDVEDANAGTGPPPANNVQELMRRALQADFEMVMGEEARGTEEHQSKTHEWHTVDPQLRSVQDMARQYVATDFKIQCDEGGFGNREIPAPPKHTTPKDVWSQTSAPSQGAKRQPVCYPPRRPPETRRSRVENACPIRPQSPESRTLATTP